MIARTRLLMSFAIALGVGTGLFGLLHALISVRVVILVSTIPHIQFAPVVLEIKELPNQGHRICIDCNWAPYVVYEQPLPTIPPIEIGPTPVEMIDERSSLEVRSFDPIEMIQAYDASTIVM